MRIIGVSKVKAVDAGEKELDYVSDLGSLRQKLAKEANALYAKYQIGIDKMASAGCEKKDINFYKKAATGVKKAADLLW